MFDINWFIFPKDFIFEGPFDDKFKQIGNAVPPPFSVFLAANILNLISGETPKTLASEVIYKTPITNSFSSVIAGIKTKARKSGQSK